MQIDIITLFPKLFEDFKKTSIVGRAIEKKLLGVNLYNLRDFGIGKHKIVDGRPFGGGAGMILRVDVLIKALESIKNSQKTRTENPFIILLDPKGKKFNQERAQNLTKKKWLILICGHYEGVDERIRNLVDEEISIGDYILTGGEIPAMAIVDTTCRLIPKVLKKEEATQQESFQKLKANNQKPTTILEYPQYTRPQNFKSLKVPSILISGNHAEISNWRKKKSLAITKKLRADLLKRELPLKKN